jgi:hypothetical protein
VSCGNEEGVDVEAIAGSGGSGGGLDSGDRSRLGEKKEPGEPGGELVFSRCLRCFFKNEGSMSSREPPS